MNTHANILCDQSGRNWGPVCWYSLCIIIPYPREKGPMCGAPYIGSKLGSGPIFQVSVSQLDAKEHPGKVPTRSYASTVTAREAGYRADTSLCAVGVSRIKWVWSRSLAMHDRSFALKRGIRWTRFSFVAVWQVTYWCYLDFLKFSPYRSTIWAAFFQGSYTWAHIWVNIRPWQEIEPKLGGGLTFRSGSSFARVRY
jgi:hypothetical protein